MNWAEEQQVLSQPRRNLYLFTLMRKRLAHNFHGMESLPENQKRKSEIK